MKRSLRTRPRETGPTPHQRLLVVNRSAGRCELCHLALWDADYGWLATHSFHHRQPRGMGGSKAETNSPERILLTCGSGTSGCHGLITSEPSDCE